MKNILLLLLSCFVSINGFSQNNFTIDGKVKFENTPLEFGEALLLDGESLTLLNYTVIDEGTFSFSNVLTGNYQVKIIAFGFKDYEQSFELNQNLQLDISLEIDEAIDLEEVVVTANKKIYSNDGGNLKMNVADSGLSSLSNPTDLLSRLPNILVSPNGESISVIGKGNPLIYLNNQRISLEQYNTLSVDEIQDIEIINNPSAKYEAEGRVVILVKLVKPKEGYKINLSELISKKNGFNNFLGISGTYNRKKLSIRSNIGYNQLQSWEQIVNNFEVINEAVYSKYEVTATGNRGVYIANAGLSYQINEKDYFAFNLNSRFRRAVGEGTTFSEFFENNELTDIENFATIIDNRNLINGQFNYNKNWNSNELFVGLQSIYYDRISLTNIQDNINSNGFQSIEDRDQIFNLLFYAGRMDYEKKINDKTTFQLGINSAISTANTTADIIDLQNADNSSFSDYGYGEQIHAVYTQLATNFEKWKYSIGLRIENTIMEGKFENENTPFLSRKNTYLFPKMNINIPIKEDHSFSLNFARSINRPQFSRLNQITYYVNPFIAISENPNLRPSLANDFTATYQIKNSSLSATYTDRIDPSFFVTTYDEVEDIYILKTQNFEQERNIIINASFPLEHDSWSSMNSFSFISNTVIDNRALNLDAKPYFYFYTNQQLKLPKDTSLFVSCWGMTKRKAGIFERNQIIALNAGISKKIFDRLNCTLSFNDIFNQINYEDFAVIEDVQSMNTFNVDSKEISLSLKYQIAKGKTAFNSKKVSDEEGRIR